jgi:2'-5' RNA ligase
MNFNEWLLNESQKYSYSSTQIDLPEKEKNKILNWSKEHIPNKVLVKNDHASGRESDTHVTILYGLHANQPKSIEKIIKNIKPFHITLGEISKFEAETHDVIKITISGTGLKRLNKLLSDLPHTSKYAYNPHCTLAYVKKGSCDHLLGSNHFKGLKIETNAITFSSKDGDKKVINLS